MVAFETAMRGIIASHDKDEEIGRHPMQISNNPFGYLRKRAFATKSRPGMDY